MSTTVLCRRCEHERRGGTYSFWVGLPAGVENFTHSSGTSWESVTIRSYRVAGRESASICDRCRIVYGLRMLALVPLLALLAALVSASAVLFLFWNFLTDQPAILAQLPALGLVRAIVVVPLVVGGLPYLGFSALGASFIGASALFGSASGRQHAAAWASHSGLEHRYCASWSPRLLTRMLWRVGLVSPLITWTEGEYASLRQSS